MPLGAWATDLPAFTALASSPGPPTPRSKRWTSCRLAAEESPARQPHLEVEQSRPPGRLGVGVQSGSTRRLVAHLSPGTCPPALGELTVSLGSHRPCPSPPPVDAPQGLSHRPRVWGRNRGDTRRDLVGARVATGAGRLDGDEWTGGRAPLGGPDRTFPVGDASSQTAAGPPCRGPHGFHRDPLKNALRRQSSPQAVSAGSGEAKSQDTAPCDPPSPVPCSGTLPGGLFLLSPRALGQGDNQACLIQ